MRSSCTSLHVRQSANVDGTDSLAIARPSGGHAPAPSAPKLLVDAVREQRHLQPDVQPGRVELYHCRLVAQLQPEAKLEAGPGPDVQEQPRETPVARVPLIGGAEPKARHQPEARPVPPAVHVIRDSNVDGV